MIAGLEDISDGQLRIGGEVANEKTPRDRDIGMVFQNYALYPHMTVYDNMAFGLKMRKFPKTEIAIGDRVVNDLPPKDRDIAMVFQNYALYPHMTWKIVTIDPDADLVPRRLALAQAEREVVAHRLVRIQRVVLEHHRDVPLLRQHARDVRELAQR